MIHKLRENRIPRQGFEERSAQTASNGETGLACIAQSKAGGIDALLLEVGVPDMAGPVIALTSNFCREDQPAAAAGMNAHFTKPVEPPPLYQTLSDTIAHGIQASADRRKRQ